MTASLTLRSSLGVHGSIVSSRRQFAPPAAHLCGVYITTGPLHAAKVTSGSKTEPTSTSFTRTSPQPAQIMNSNGKSRLRGGEIEASTIMHGGFQSAANRDLGELANACAILDRFLHHARVVTFAGKSFRLKHTAGAAASGDAT